MYKANKWLNKHHEKNIGHQRELLQAEIRNHFMFEYFMEMHGYSDPWKFSKEWVDSNGEIYIRKTQAKIVKRFKESPERTRQILYATIRQQYVKCKQYNLGIKEEINEH